MKILVIGSGGREHALVWKISKSPLVKEIFCAPGNAGMESLAKCVPIAADDILKLKEFALKEKIDLTVVGPEQPLTLGIADEFLKHGLKIFGPQRKAAQLEGSKLFSKDVMRKQGVPTAKCESFSEYSNAVDYLNNSSFPLVIKADGLAAGKGVLVAKELNEANQFLEKVMIKKIFGESGKNVLIEECLVGVELSVLAFLDGKSIGLLPEARDHKRIFDKDLGPNTGGMGAFSPVSGIKKDFLNEVLSRVFIPMQKGLAEEGIPYCGVLYAGLMITEDGPKVLEFNVRFGDPETQVILPRIKTDLVEIMLACCEGRLDEIPIELANETALCVVLASGGYPDAYQNGYEIKGLEHFTRQDEVLVFHAGTKRMDEKVVTHGGRVMGVTALGAGMEEVRKKVYAAIHQIKFEKMQYRKDIGL